ncbi:MAG: hypothetical protein SAK29_05945 [Scytonema sp. PMC 1069.18]|nr:hypothetical protein [Scytonema sp. PMC 1069.18]MEC4882522.1 hypothetical protein [Scytonema sp. PMC 1070.18]
MENQSEQVWRVCDRSLEHRYSNAKNPVTSVLAQRKISLFDARNRVF